jgi:hypothetical protein
MKPGYVYAIQPVGLDLVKIGCTSDPASRAESIASFSPLPMTFRHLLRVSCFGAAKAYEAYVLGATHSVASHGEWRHSLEFVDDCFGCIAPAVDATADFSIKHRKGSKRNGMTLERADGLAAVAEAIARIASEKKGLAYWEAEMEARKQVGLGGYVSRIGDKSIGLAREYLSANPEAA